MYDPTDWWRELERRTRVLEICRSRGDVAATLIAQARVDSAFKKACEMKTIKLV